jgi:hypothetical protein
MAASTRGMSYSKGLGQVPDKYFPNQKFIFMANLIIHPITQSEFQERKSWQGKICSTRFFRASLA